MDRLQHLVKSKFAKDSLWLLCSQAILSSCALLINILISQRFSSEGFGVFSLSFKIYLIASIFASFATNVVALRFISQFNLKKEKEEKCISTAFSITIISSLVLVVAGILCAPVFASIFNEERMLLCIITFFIGMPFFAINKFYFNVLNGLRKMKLFSILQSLRWVLIGAVAIVVSITDKFSLEYFCMAFPLTEFILFVTSAILVRKYFASNLGWNKKWVKEHFNFGCQSVISYSTTEIFTHIDVFVLGVFSNVSTVGLYSFAADIAKSLFAFTDILQTNFNPIISDLWWKKQFSELNKKIKQLRNYTYLLYIPICLLSIVVYYILIQYIFKDTIYTESYNLFVILCLGIFLFSGVKPFMAVPELCGFLKLKLIANLLILMLSLGLNIVFVYYYDVIGVAVATVFSYLIYALLLNFIIHKKIKITLLFNWL